MWLFLLKIISLKINKLAYLFKNNLKFICKLFKKSLYLLYN